MGAGTTFSITDGAVDGITFIDGSASVSGGTLELGMDKCEYCGQVILS